MEMGVKMRLPHLISASVKDWMLYTGLALSHGKGAHLQRTVQSQQASCLSFSFFQ